MNSVKKSFRQTAALEPGIQVQRSVPEGKVQPRRTLVDVLIPLAGLDGAKSPLFPHRPLLCCFKEYCRMKESVDQI